MVFFIVYLVLAVVFAVIGAEMARARNRDAAAWALICALVPLLGVIALAVAGKASAQTAYLPTLPHQRPQQSSPTKVEVESKAYDETKWRALLDVDDEVASVAKSIEGYGASYVDEFAEKYLALGDKAYLQSLSAKIIDRAEKHQESQAARQMQEEIDRADEADKAYFEYLEKLKNSDGVDPDYHRKVSAVARYTGNAKAFRNGVKVSFEDGTFALKGGFLIRHFKTEAELDEWGR